MPFLRRLLVLCLACRLLSPCGLRMSGLFRGLFRRSPLGGRQSGWVVSALLDGVLIVYLDWGLGLLMGLGLVLTVKALLTARFTLRQCRSISSIVTSFVSSIPIATIARLSPTRTISIPAVSATWPLGKSDAVRTVMGSFFL